MATSSWLLSAMAPIVGTTAGYSQGTLHALPSFYTTPGRWPTVSLLKEPFGSQRLSVDPIEQVRIVLWLHLLQEIASQART